MTFQSLDMNNMDFNELSRYFSEFVESVEALEAIKSTDFENKISKTNVNECKNCCGDNFVEDFSQGIVVCTQCGEVSRNMFDQNPEWKQYDDDDKAGARCNQAFNVLLPQSSLGTSVGGYANSRTKRLHSWVQMPYKERSLNNEFKVIHDICQKAGILKCVEDDTKIMYKMASECKHQTGTKIGKPVITRGVNRKSIVAACLFFACVRKGVTRTSKEIAQLWGIAESDMNKGRRNLQKLFKIKDTARKAMLNTETSKPEHFIRRFCNALQIKNKYIDDALKIAINIEKLNIISSHTPCSSAAASILLMAEINNLDHITKKKLAIQFDISDSTIFKTYKEMEPYKHVLMNNESTDKIVKQISKEMTTQKIPQEIIDRMKKFGIEPGQQQQQHIVSVVSVVSDQSEIESESELELELELDENCDDTDDFFECSDTIDSANSANSTNSTIDDDNIDIKKSLQNKFTSINKLLKNKSLKDLKKEMGVLMRSHDLIKSIRNDLDKYTKNNF